MQGWGDEVLGGLGRLSQCGWGLHNVLQDHREGMRAGGGGGVKMCNRGRAPAPVPGCLPTPPPPRPSPEGRPGAVVGGPAVGLPPIADGGSRRGAHGLPHQTVATCAMRAVLVGFPHGPGPPQPPGCSHPLARPSRMVARGRWSGQSGGGAASMGASGPVLRLPTLGSSSTALLQPPRPRKRPRHPAIGGINMSPCRMWRVEAGPDPPACLERVCRGRGCPPVGQAGPATRLATGPLQDDLALLADGAPRSPGYRL